MWSTPAFRTSRENEGIYLYSWDTGAEQLRIRSAPVHVPDSSVTHRVFHVHQKGKKMQGSGQDLPLCESTTA